MTELTWEFRVEFDPDRPRSLTMLRAAGFPEDAIKPDSDGRRATVDLDVVLAAGWRLVDGTLYGPPAACL